MTTRNSPFAVCETSAKRRCVLQQAAPPSLLPAPPADTAAILSQDEPAEGGRKGDMHPNVWKTYRTVWFQPVDGYRQPLCPASILVFCAYDTVAHFQDAALTIAQTQLDVFHEVENGWDLTLYASRDACKEGQALAPLDCEETQVVGLDVGTTIDDPLIVQEPKYATKQRHTGLVTSLVFRHAAPLCVRSQEFNLLDTMEEHVGELVATPCLHHLWEDHGGFPESYFIRRDQVECWRALQPHVMKMKQPPQRRRVALFGSVGAGRCTLALLLAAYLACVERRRVLVLRRVRHRYHDHGQDDHSITTWVMYLDGTTGSVAHSEGEGLTDEQVSYLRDDKRLCGVTTIALDYPHAYLKDPVRGWPRIDVVVPSGPVICKNMDFFAVCVLPAWRFQDLFQFAELSRVWNEQKQQQECGSSSLRKRVKKQYYFSGGDLRAFCQLVVPDRLELDVDAYRRHRVDRPDDKDHVKKYVELMTTSVDWALQRGWSKYYRFYIRDRHDYYGDFWGWPGIVDSGYALSKLAPWSTTENLFEVFQTAERLKMDVLKKTVFKWLFHRAVSEASSLHKPVVIHLACSEQSAFLETISIGVSNTHVGSDDVSSFLQELKSSILEDTYWFRTGPGCPLVDAVTTCQVTARGGKVATTMVALIKITTSSIKPLTSDQWRLLNSALDSNPRLAALPRVALVVTCDKGQLAQRIPIHSANRGVLETAVMMVVRVVGDVDPRALVTPNAARRETMPLGETPFDFVFDERREQQVAADHHSFN